MPETPQAIRRSRVRAAHAPVRMLVIDEEKIRDATKRDSAHCMIAEAIKVAYPGARRVAVDLQTIRFTDPVKPQRYTYLTPRAAQIALVKFDQGHADIEPFTVQLRSGVVTSTVKSESERQRAREQRTAVPRALRPNRVGDAVADGGTATPPRAALATPAVPGGRRRTFGLRAFEL